MLSGALPSFPVDDELFVTPHPHCSNLPKISRKQNEFLPPLPISACQHPLRCRILPFPSPISPTLLLPTRIAILAIATITILVTSIMCNAIRTVHSTATFRWDRWRWQRQLPTALQPPTLRLHLHLLRKAWERMSVEVTPSPICDTLDLRRHHYCHSQRSSTCS